jgi:hypothetical protein
MEPEFSRPPVRPISLRTPGGEGSAQTRQNPGSVPVQARPARRVQEESTSAKGNAAPKAPPVAHENIIVGTRTDLFKPKDFLLSHALELQEYLITIFLLNSQLFRMTSMFTIFLNLYCVAALITFIYTCTR